jgi:hypothetical protein
LGLLDYKEFREYRAKPAHKELREYRVKRALELPDHRVYKELRGTQDY